MKRKKSDNDTVIYVGLGLNFASGWNLLLDVVLQYTPFVSVIIDVFARYEYRVLLLHVCAC